MIFKRREGGRERRTVEEFKGRKYNLILIETECEELYYQAIDSILAYKEKSEREAAEREERAA